LAIHHVEVTVISPGYAQTNLSINALTGSGMQYGQMDPSTSSGHTPEYVAGRAVSAMMRGEKDVIISSLLPRIVLFLRNFWPSLFFRLMSNRAKEEAQAQIPHYH
jgi:dehydrogenase/reductase SDR family protein 7B